MRCMGSSRDEPASRQSCHKRNRAKPPQSSNPTAAATCAPQQSHTRCRNYHDNYKCGVAHRWVVVPRAPSLDASREQARHARQRGTAPPLPAAPSSRRGRERCVLSPLPVRRRLSHRLNAPCRIGRCPLPSTAPLLPLAASSRCRSLNTTSIPPQLLHPHSFGVWRAKRARRKSSAHLPPPPHTRRDAPGI